MGSQAENYRMSVWVWWLHNGLAVISPHSLHFFLVLCEDCDRTSDRSRVLGVKLVHLSVGKTVLFASFDGLLLGLFNTSLIITTPCR